ncbi:hypothetical protein [Schleiferilactobacillus harbinensis]|uniref:Uncharacterized protein n=1 Tax=Schleiferilactobacillus harbinensis TaxID=304207 RepID=A0A5P8M3C0_9LACO|nr:hypothetical protein [Schleiferilactobacillus harbinensis]QEU46186.1 hypothetical protein FMM01_01990 [Schleiferilactobacillus harbinensis]QFR22986.1 hypothetical protein D1010_05760 [Schleiferilactobacillus harbinensis]
MKKIEPTPMEDWALQQQVSHYQTMTPVLGPLRAAVRKWEGRLKGGDHHADQERKAAGPEAH